MHEIDTTYAQNGEFVDGAPPSTEGTIVDAAWLNAVQRELLNVITVAGMAPSKSDQTQLLQALQVLAAPKPPIELTDWITNPNEYTVKAMNIDNADGVGADCFFKYVFIDGVSPMMRTQTYPLPFSGYGLQFNFSWRGTVAGNGSSYAHFRADVAAIPAGVAVGQIRTWSEWTTFFNAYSSVKKTSVTYTPIPTGSADTFQTVTGTNLVVPASIYDQGDVLLINFWRISSDTYSGQVEVGKISLVPALAA